MTKPFPKWLRRIGFKIAFRGCYEERASAFVSRTMRRDDLTHQLRIERGLVLEFYARDLR